jgi:hypothetical protein
MSHPRVPIAPTALLSALLVFGSAGGARASTVVANFSGLSLANTSSMVGYNYAPPDSDGAIGINNFVEFINGGFAVYNRNGSLAAPAITDTQFWLNAGTSPTLVGQGLSDTRIKYDPITSRWFATEITLGNSSNLNNSVLVGVSAGSNPLGAWHSTSYTAVSPTLFGDYSTLNIDANAVYIGTNNFNPSNFAGVTLSSIPIASLLALAPTTTGIATFTQAGGAVMGFTPQVPTNYGTGYSGSNIVAISATTYNEAKITPIHHTGAAGASLGSTSTVIITYDSQSSPACQPNATCNIDTLDDRFSSTVYQVGNLIYAANTVDNAGRAAVHWMVFDASTGKLKQEGLITDGARDLFQPSIAVNAAGDVVIGYNESGLDLNISSFAAVGHTVAGILSFTEQLLLATSPVGNYTDGFSSTNPDRWGDYSMTMVDPTDSTVFWTIQELAAGSSTWGTRISAIQVSGSDVGQSLPEPGTFALMLAAGLGLIGAGRYKKQGRV